MKTKADTTNRGDHITTEVVRKCSVREGERDRERAREKGNRKREIDVGLPEQFKQWGRLFI